VSPVFSEDEERKGGNWKVDIDKGDLVFWGQSIVE
jgi:hypothetical protein